MVKIKKSMSLNKQVAQKKKRSEKQILYEVHCLRKNEHLKRSYQSMLDEQL